MLYCFLLGLIEIGGSCDDFGIFVFCLYMVEKSDFDIIGNEIFIFGRLLLLYCCIKILRELKVWLLYYILLIVNKGLFILIKMVKLIGWRMKNFINWNI